MLPVEGIGEDFAAGFMSSSFIKFNPVRVGSLSNGMGELVTATSLEALLMASEFSALN